MNLAHTQVPRLCRLFRRRRARCIKGYSPLTLSEPTVVFNVGVVEVYWLELTQENGDALLFLPFLSYLPPYLPRPPHITIGVFTVAAAAADADAATVNTPNDNDL